jgi:hypothetical protein
MAGIRKINIPDDVHLVNMNTGELFDSEIGGVVSFHTILRKLLNNPQWSKSYAMLRSAAAIEKAYLEAKDGVMTLSEEDWQHLRQAVEKPEELSPSGQSIAGYGFMPGISVQLLPLLDAVMNANNSVDVAPAT